MTKLPQCYTMSSNRRKRYVMLRMKNDIKAASAEKQLRNEIIRGKNLAPTPDITKYQNSYLGWINDVERLLRSLFIDPEVWNHLYDDRHWQIYNLHEESPRAKELIWTATGVQTTLLSELADRLKRLIDRVEAAPGLLTVLDTNVLLHYLPPEKIKWSSVVGTPEVRLILPIRVIEEMDEKKYTARDDLADRARRVLSQLRSLLEEKKGGPTKLCDGVTIEASVFDEPRQRTLDADQEILNCCLELISGDGEVVLVTGDTGMRLRARAFGIRVVDMPEKWLRRRPKPEEVE